MAIKDDTRELITSQSDVYRKQRSVEVFYGSKSGGDKKDHVTAPTARMERWFPTGFKHELKELYAFAWPLVLTTFLNFLIRVTGTMFSGQLGAVELDAVAMGVSIANVIGTSIGIGLIAACDTLFTQSYGSTNKKQVGVYLQTAIIISSLSCVLSWALLFNTNYILLVCGQNPAVAQATEEFMFYFMPALYFLFLFQLLQKYLQVQGIIKPVVIISIIANVVNVGLQYLILNVLLWGIKGSAIGQSISYFILAALTLAYMLFTGCHQKTWGGWSKRSFKDWGEFMKLGLSSIAMICLEWWTYEVSAFLSGILGDIELGASSIAYQIWVIYASFPIGISSAVAFRVGRYLGEERVDAALSVTRVTFVMGGLEPVLFNGGGISTGLEPVLFNGGVILSVVSGLVTLSLNKQLPYLFSNDAEIIALARQLLLLLAIFNCLGCLKNIFGGIIRGTGRMVAGGIVSFVAFFVIALPIGVSLMFLTSLRTAGFWWGLLIGMFIACVSLVVIVLKTDWPEESKQAQVRAKSAKTKRKRKVSERLYEDPDETSGLLGNGGLGNGGLANGTDKLHGDITEYYRTQSMVMSTSFEFETPLLRKNYWRKIMIEKTTIISICFALLAFGIICRFAIFIPPKIPLNYTLNTTTTLSNVTTYLVQ